MTKLEYTQWKGTDWSAATLRPGCLDYERVPSMRGGLRVPYQPPMYFATGSVHNAVSQTNDRTKSA